MCLKCDEETKQPFNPDYKRGVDPDFHAKYANTSMRDIAHQDKPFFDAVTLIEGARMVLQVLRESGGGNDKRGCHQLIMAAVMSMNNNQNDEQIVDEIKDIILMSRHHRLAMEATGGTVNIASRGN